MKLSFKNKLLLSVSPYLNFYEPQKRLLPTPIWFLPNCFPELSPAVIFNTLFKVENEKYVAKSFIGKTKYISLTGKGLDKLLFGVNNLRFLRELWDGNMRLVLFDVPEQDRKLRDELRFGLLDLGFAMWQKSVFITPHLVDKEVTSLVGKLGLENEVNMMLVKPLNRKLNELAWSLWNLRSLNGRYNIFISQTRELLKEKVTTYKRWVIRCQRLRFEYYEMLTNEPFLPEQITGREYSTAEASSCFLELGEKLTNVLERV